MYRTAAVICFAFLTLFCSACKTDYSEEAADTAREYALKKLKGLNQEQRYFIRYTQPEIYSNLIFPQTVIPLTNADHVKLMHPHRFPVAPSRDFMHHCFVWAPPGLDTKVVVVGEGERSLRFWEPTRVILKNYVPGTPSFTAAMKQAVHYAQNKMPQLSESERNRIRFSEPEVVYTRFPIRIQRPKPVIEKAPDDPDGLLGYKEVRQPVITQISLVWKADRENTFIAVIGTSLHGTLYRWTVNSGQYVTKPELTGKTLSEAETASIRKEYGPEENRLVFPVEPNVNRGNRRKETGSIFGGE